MLLSLLGEFVNPGEGMAWTSAVLAAFERLGVAEKATRQALMRTSNAGLLKPDKIGRRTRWQLTPAARKLLTDGAERIYSFGPATDWDGQWVLVAARIPETDRHARHVVRARRTGLSDTRQMVAAAWDLAAIEAEYEQFIAEFRDKAPADMLARQLELVHAWRRFPSLDPALPRELLPVRWSGIKAAELFADRHGQWQADSRREWKRLNSQP